MMDLQPRVNFSSFIVVEPGISLKNHPETDKASSSMTAWTWLRRDTWTSRKSARKELERNPLYAMWDPRVLDLYIVSARFEIVDVTTQYAEIWLEDTPSCYI